MSERKVRAVIARGARTIDEIGEKCGAGTRCGGCWPLLDDLLAEIDGRERSAVGAGTGALTGNSHFAA